MILGQPENVNCSHITNKSKKPYQWNPQSFNQILNLGENYFLISFLNDRNQPVGQILHFDKHRILLTSLIKDDLCAKGGKWIGTSLEYHG